MSNVITSQIAKHLREVFSGGNWTDSNFRDNLADVTWQEAIAKVQNFNTIATLAFHIGYFVNTSLGVLQDKGLQGHDKYSFTHPPISNNNEWVNLRDGILKQAGELANLIEVFPDDRLTEDFTDNKYGNYYRNFHGMIEHTHYHLGQIALLKKMVRG